MTTTHCATFAEALAKSREASMPRPAGTLRSIADDGGLYGWSGRELAEELRASGDLCRTFDYALPQQWVDAVHDRTGVWPQTLGMVWAYPDNGPGHIWGRPFALTQEAAALLARVPELAS
jgi:hypothetical protein